MLLWHVNVGVAPTPHLTLLTLIEHLRILLIAAYPFPSAIALFPVTDVIPECRLLPPTRYRMLTTVHLLLGQRETHPLDELTPLSSLATLKHRFPHPLDVFTVPSLRLDTTLPIDMDAHLTGVGALILPVDLAPVDALEEDAASELEPLLMVLTILMVMIVKIIYPSPLSPPPSTEPSSSTAPPVMSCIPHVDHAPRIVDPVTPRKAWPPAAPPPHYPKSTPQRPRMKQSDPDEKETPPLTKQREPTRTTGSR